MARMSMPYLAMVAASAAKMASGRQLHHIAGDLQHDRPAARPGPESAGALSSSAGHGGADEDREHHDLQDLVVGHRVEDRLGHQVGDEVRAT
jgi:hypothetical protein